MKYSYISIIVPVYNAERTLRKCIDSILEQTYTNYELLLVDDGSSDQSGNICDEYAIKDNRVQVFHKTNEGVSKARNWGLDRAKGEWITFVDSDDTVSANYLENLVKCVSINEMLVFNGCKVIKHGSINRLFEVPDITYEKEYISKGFSELSFFKHGSPWAKLFNKDVISKYDIRFCQQFSNYEDLLFCMEYLLHINILRFSSDCDYTYYISSNSLNSHYHGFYGELHLLDIYSELLFQLKGKMHSEDNAELYKTEFVYRAILSMYKKTEYPLRQKIIHLLFLTKKMRKYMGGKYIAKRNIYQKFLFLLLRARMLYTFNLVVTLKNKLR